MVPPIIERPQPPFLIEKRNSSRWWKAMQARRCIHLLILNGHFMTSSFLTRLLSLFRPAFRLPKDTFFPKKL